MIKEPKEFFLAAKSHLWRMTELLAESCMAENCGYDATDGFYRRTIASKLASTYLSKRIYVHPKTSYTSMRRNDDMHSSIFSSLSNDKSPVNDTFQHIDCSELDLSSTLKKKFEEPKTESRVLLSCDMVGVGLATLDSIFETGALSRTIR